MPRIDTDFTNVDVPVPAGMYRAECSGAQMKATKSDGSTMVVWEFSIIDEGDQIGRKLYYNSNLADKRTVKTGPKMGQIDEDAIRKANYYLREFLKKLGAPYDPAGFETEQALHCQAILEVVIENFEGRDVSRVKNVMATPETIAALAAAQ